MKKRRSPDYSFGPGRKVVFGSAGVPGPTTVAPPGSVATGGGGEGGKGGKNEQQVNRPLSKAYNSQVSFTNPPSVCTYVKGNSGCRFSPCQNTLSVKVPPELRLSTIKCSHAAQILQLDLKSMIAGCSAPEYQECKQIFEDFLGMVNSICSKMPFASDRF